MVFTFIAAHPRCRDGEHGAQTLAAGINQVPGKLGDQIYIGAGFVHDDAVDARHVIANEIEQKLQTGFRLSRARKWNYYSQDWLPLGTSIWWQYILLAGSAVKLIGMLCCRICPEFSHSGRLKAISGECRLKELFRSNDAVLLSFVEAILSDAGVTHQIADGYMSIMEGSLGVLPRRVLVAEDEWAQARRILKDADLEHVVGQD
jgi:hypothetical protein